jgi:DNA gyrase inhibitor GyrI
VISNYYLIDDSICESQLSGGKYFIYKVKHTAEGIQKAWAEIFPTLQNSGYQVDNKPILERYSSDMINNDYCEICVPVKPL